MDGQVFCLPFTKPKVTINQCGGQKTVAHPRLCTIPRATAIFINTLCLSILIPFNPKYEIFLEL